MNYYSTSKSGKIYTLKEAVLQGLPEDNGLFMPEFIPVIDNNIINDLKNLSFTEIAKIVSHAFLKNDIPGNKINEIVEKAINFPAPIVEIDSDTSVLELFHGPTLAFKDFGARFMAELMSYLVKDNNKKLTILVATSGDTGGAVANGFLNKEGVDVIILYPSGKVSKLQEQQLTTCGSNIIALEIDGTFDDCQRLVKSAFLDTDLQDEYFLSSANSINISRLIPQTFYYFEAFKQIQHKNRPVIFSVPSGNFGNLTAGVLAKKMGLPVAKFIAAVNSNNVFTKYLETGIYQPQTSVRTLSNAMDVGAPSNFARLMDIYNNDLSLVKNDIISYSFTDAETTAEINRIFDEKHYILDPHGAIATLGCKKHQQNQSDALYIALETAHPAKFQEEMEHILPGKVSLPDALAALSTKESSSVKLSASFDDLKNWMLS